MPVQAAQQLQIGQTRIPTVKDYRFRLKAPFMSLFHHLLEVVVLAQTILALVWTRGSHMASGSRGATSAAIGWSACALVSHRVRPPLETRRAPEHRSQSLVPHRYLYYNDRNTPICSSSYAGLPDFWGRYCSGVTVQLLTTLYTVQLTISQSF